jgi:hypothetical protein
MKKVTMILVPLVTTLWSPHSWQASGSSIDWTMATSLKGLMLLVQTLTDLFAVQEEQAGVVAIRGLIQPKNMGMPI